MGVDLKLYARTPEPVSNEKLRELNYRFMEASDLGYGVNPIRKEVDYAPQDGFHYYEVETMSRLYDKGYARGHFPEIYAAIEWLRRNMPNCEIIYGGDHTDLEYLPVLTKDDQEALLQHWAETGGLTYRQSIPREPAFQRECPNCVVIMSQSMWSGANGRLTCQGCKHQEETRDGGNTWFVVEKKP